MTADLDELPAHGVVGARHAHQFARPRQQRAWQRPRQAAAREIRKTRAAEAEDFDAEAEIARINGIIAKIDTALALPDLFKRDSEAGSPVSKARAGAASALLRAEEEWLVASSQYDEATG